MTWFEFLHMGWPTACVFATFFICATVAYSIRKQTDVQEAVESAIEYERRRIANASPGSPPRGGSATKPPAHKG